jgi:hypothetical protein
VNPANRSPALHQMRQLSENVIELLKNSSVDKVLSIYNIVKEGLKSLTISSSTKHILINQAHEGVSKLLNITVSASELAQVFIGKSGVLRTII